MALGIEAALRTLFCHVSLVHVLARNLMVMDCMCRAMARTLGI
jgi:hypothetical protein